MQTLASILVIGVLLLSGRSAPSETSMQQQGRCFAATGHCIDNRFLGYWERNGGLAVFGYPISDLITNETVEDTWVGPTQWFERARLEDHGAAGIAAGRLGAALLELQGRSWWGLPYGGAQPNCLYVGKTNHSLCEPFLSYWQRNGGLAHFGYPISEPMEEQIGAWRGTVQYFERSRMEYHAELAGTRYAVLLGRLGAEVSALAPPVRCTTVFDPALAAWLPSLPFRDSLGCPTQLYSAVPAAVQRMEHGAMLWFDFGADGKQIYYMYRVPAPGDPFIFGHTSDTWQAGVDPEDYPISAPAGLYPPRRGFGKVWWMTFRRGPNFIGLGIEPERAEQATVQRTSSGALLVRLQQTGWFYAFGRSSYDLFGADGR